MTVMVNKIGVYDYLSQKKNKTRIKLSSLKEFKDYIGQLCIYICREREKEIGVL